MSTTPAARTAMLDQPTLTVRELAAVLGIGLGTTYSMIREGRIRTLKAGRRILIPASAVRELLDGVEP